MICLNIWLNVYLQSNRTGRKFEFSCFLLKKSDFRYSTSNSSKEILLEQSLGNSSNKVFKPTFYVIGKNLFRLVSSIYEEIFKRSVSFNNKEIFLRSSVYILIRKQCKTKLRKVTVQAEKVKLTITGQTVSKN